MYEEQIRKTYSAVNTDVLANVLSRDVDEAEDALVLRLVVGLDGAAAEGRALTAAGGGRGDREEGKGGNNGELGEHGE